MSRACPVGHPSAAGMKNCPLCGRKYVDETQVVLPPTKEQVLNDWRARKRAARAAAAEAAAQEATAVAAAAETVIPSARASAEDHSAEDHSAEDHSAEDHSVEDRSTTWTQTLEVAPKLLSVGAAAMFVSAFALGESVALGFFS